MRDNAWLARGRIALASVLPLLIFALVWANPASADDTPSTRNTLKGITTISVLAGPTSLEAENDGLVRDQIQTDVELRLRQAGITVNSNVPPNPLEMLVVYVQTRKNRLGAYAYAVNVEFWQLVCVRAQTDKCTLAPTWSVSGIGLESASSLRDVRRVVADYVDQFINAYLEQNPKR